MMKLLALCVFLLLPLTPQANTIEEAVSSIDQVSKNINIAGYSDNIKEGIESLLAYVTTELFEESFKIHFSLPIQSLIFFIFVFLLFFPFSAMEGKFHIDNLLFREKRRPLFDLLICFYFLFFCCALPVFYLLTHLALQKAAFYMLYVIGSAALIKTIFICVEGEARTSLFKGVPKEIDHKASYALLKEIFSISYYTNIALATLGFVGVFYEIELQDKILSKEHQLLGAIPFIFDIYLLLVGGLSLGLLIPHHKKKKYLSFLYVFIGAAIIAFSLSFFLNKGSLIAAIFVFILASLGSYFLAQEHTKKIVARIEDTPFTKNLSSITPLHSITHMILTLIFLGSVVGAGTLIYMHAFYMEALKELGPTIVDFAIRTLTIWLIFYLAKTIHRTLKLVFKEAAESQRRNFSKEKIGSRFITFLSMFMSFFLAVLWVIAALLILAQFGISGTYLLTALALAFAFIGFVARDSVSDILSGLSYISQNIIAVGAVLKVNNDIRGRVERVTLRSFSVRDNEGIVHTIDYSKVSAIGSYVDSYTCILIDLEINYEEDIDRVVKVIKDIGVELRKDYGKRILEDIEFQGVAGFGNAGLQLRFRLKVAPLEHQSIKWDCNRRIKERFDAEKIDIPFTQYQIRLINSEK